MEILWVIIKWVSGVSIALAGAWFDFKNNKKKMSNIRKWQELTSDVQIDILETFVGYAKKDIENGDFEADETVLSIALLYGWVFELTPTDFNLIDIQTIVSWHGSKPPRPPKP